MRKPEVGQSLEPPSTQYKSTDVGGMVRWGSPKTPPATLENNGGIETTSEKPPRENENVIDCPRKNT